ncbi:MAG: OmpA family protein [Bacteroidetes bacterium]|nr:OmpA family protein [Bacteroidota bacterium]
MRILIATLFVFSILELSAQSQPITFSVYFEKGKADLNPADALTIDDFLALAKDSSYNAVFVKGYADPDGSDASNMSLSEARVGM